MLCLRLATVSFLGSGGDLGWRLQLCAVQEIHHHLLSYGAKMTHYKHSYASFGSCHHSPPTDRSQLQSYKKPSLEPLRYISIWSTGPLSNSLSVDLRLQGLVYVFSHLTQSYKLLLLSAKTHTFDSPFTPQEVWKAHFLLHQ